MVHAWVYKTDENGIFSSRCIQSSSVNKCFPPRLSANDVSRSFLDSKTCIILHLSSLLLAACVYAATCAKNTEETEIVIMHIAHVFIHTANIYIFF